MDIRFFHHISSFLGILLGSMLLTACAVPNPELALEEFNQAISGRIPDAVVWRSDAEEDIAVDARVEALVAEPLTVQSSVQVALLNNRSLQARYASLGIAQAEAVQLGLLENPLFEIMVRPSTERGFNIEMGLMQNLVDLLMRPARRKLADAEYEAEKLELAAYLVGFVGDVQGAYYNYKGALSVLQLVEDITSTASDAANLAKAFYDAGNMTELELAAQQAKAGMADIDRLEAEQDARESRLELSEFLGMGHDAEWRVDSSLSSIPDAHVRLANLEDKALRNRFDLAAHRSEIRAAIVELGLEEDFGLLEGTEFSVSAEKEPEGEWLIGPALTIPLPLFDQGQARVTAESMALRRAQDELIAEQAHIRLQVKKAADALVLSRRRAEHLRQIVLPLRERIVRLTLLDYNFMLESPFHLLEAQQNQNETALDYVEALTDYWIARSALQAATGGGALPIEPILPGVSS